MRRQVGVWMAILLCLGLLSSSATLAEISRTTKGEARFPYAGTQQFKAPIRNHAGRAKCALAETSRTTKGEAKSPYAGTQKFKTPIRNRAGRAKYALAETSRTTKGEARFPYAGTQQFKATICNHAGRAKCASVLCLKSSEYKATVTTKLQKKAGDAWLTVSGATWDKTGTGIVPIEALGSRNLEKVHMYRTYASARVTDAHGKYIETITAVSSSISY